MKKFKDAKIQTFLQMISNDKTQLDKKLKLVDEALVEGSKIYKSSPILTNFITDIDKQIDNCKGQLVQIYQAYDPTANLISSIEGQILNISKKLRNFEKEERIIWQESELWNLIDPRLDTLIYHKIECIHNMSQVTPTYIVAIEFHAYILNGFVLILEKLRASWNTYLGFLKMAYVDILNHVYN